MQLIAIKERQHQLLASEYILQHTVHPEMYGEFPHVTETSAQPVLLKKAPRKSKGRIQNHQEENKWSM